MSEITVSDTEKQRIFELSKCTQSIKTLVMDSVYNFCVIGFYLKKVRDEELYKEAGWNGFGEYVKEEFGFSNAVTTRYMQINDKFSVDGNSLQLDDKYTTYNKSQLQEMLYLSDSQLEQVSPDMTVKEIRSIRKPEEPTVEQMESIVNSMMEPPNEQIPGQVTIEEWDDGSYVPDAETEVVVESEVVDPEEIATSQMPDAVTGPVLLKPDDRQRWYLNAFARHLIKCKKEWFLKDYVNRVMNVDKSPAEIKAMFGDNSRTWYFSAPGTEGVAHINLFDDYVQLWNEDAVCEGDFEWFYLAAAIQSMWNTVAMEEAACGSNDDTAEAEACEAPEEDLTNRKKWIFRDLISNEMKTLDTMRDYWRENQPDTLLKHELIIESYQRMLDNPEKAHDTEELPEEDIDVMTPTPLPDLRNNEQRQEWLGNYKEWGLWYRDDHIDVNYYKYDFTDGSRLVVAEYPNRRRYYSKGYEDESHYHLLEKDYEGYGGKYDKQYVHSTDSLTYMVDFLKKQKKRESG